MRSPVSPATLAVCLALRLVSPSFMQAQVLPFQHYTADNGLLSNATSSMFQDSRGYLHIGSSEGLSTFDGYTFTHTRTRNGLPSNFIFSINELPSFPGVLWLSTTHGFARIDSDHITPIVVDTTERSRLAYAIQEDITHQLWCGTRDGLYTIRNDSITKVPLPVGRVHTIDILRPGPDGLIRVAVNNLLLTFTPARTLAQSTLLHPSPDQHFSEAFQDRYGNIWIGLGDSTLSRYHNGARTHTRHISSGRVLHLTDDTHQTLYIGTEGGLLTIPIEKFGEGAFERLGPENGLPGRQVIAALVDNEENLWLACEGAGIAKLRTAGLQEFPLPGIPPAYNNMRAACDTAGHLWIPSGTGIVELRKTGRSTWAAFRHTVGGASRGVLNGIFCDWRNRLWVSFAAGEIRPYAIHYQQRGKSGLQPLPHAGVRRPVPPSAAFLVDRSDRLWYMDSVSLCVKDDSLLHRYGLNDLVNETDVRTIVEDRQGSIWLGGFSKGIAVLQADSSGARPRVLAPPGGIPAGFIRAFCEDLKGRMWVGTRYDGCFIVGPDGIHVLSAADVLPSDAVWTIARDKQGTMWLGTSEGMVAINPSTLQHDPIGNDLVGQTVVASGATPAGDIWFITPSGLGIVDRGRLASAAPPPRVHFSRMEVDGRLVRTDHPLEFPYDRNNCMFSFLAISFRNTQNILYQYRLAGADADWQQPAHQRSVRYASLRPGTYTFEVRAVRPGVSSFGPPAAVTFTITPPFWERWWFRLGVGLVAAGLVFGAYRRRVRTLERDRQVEKEFSLQLMESQENERKRIAGELHDSLVQNLLIAKNRSLMGLQHTEDPGRVQSELGEISGVLSSAIEEVREIAHNLRPYQLDRLGLSKATRSLIAKVAESTSIHLTGEIEDVDKYLDETATIQTYRIVQEALNNILKHSQAGSASVSLTHHGHATDLRISDDGKGMDLDGTHSPGFGLGGISQRVGLIGGTFQVTSSPGAGTSLVIRIPERRSSDGK